MNQQVKCQSATRKASYPVQPQRFSFSRYWRLGLIALNLGGVLLVSMIVFALVPVAHAMNLAQPLKLTPTPTNTSTPVPTPTDTPTPEPVQPPAIDIDRNSIPAVVLRNTTFTLRGTANPGAHVRFVKNSPTYPNPEIERMIGDLVIDVSGQWVIYIQFDLVANYWVQARIVTDNDTVIASSAKLSIRVSEPSPTPTNSPANTPTPATEAGPTATPTPVPVDAEEAEEEGTAVETETP